VLDGLAAAGYACWPLVVGARHVGAPHRRDRVWIVACPPIVAPSTTWWQTPGQPP
jgi:DNA (cytosine-5)-methyltransferase 1